jgi:MoxR-like ATPase
VLLFGPPGTGKTWAGTHVRGESVKVYSITITEGMSVAELLGHYIPSGDAKEPFKWKSMGGNRKVGVPRWCLDGVDICGQTHAFDYGKAFYKSV